MLRPLLGTLAAFDLLLGSAALLSPGLLAGLLWPAAGPGGLTLLRRTGALWLFFCAAEAAACRRPEPGRLRLVALLRWMDVPADAAWALSAVGLTAFGRASLWAAPALNLAVGWLLWRQARMASRSC